MPVRGRPERPHSNPPEGRIAFGQGPSHEASFEIQMSVEDALYDEFDLRFGVADLQQDTFEIGFAAADLRTRLFATGFGVSDVDGDENTIDAFSVAFGVGEELGYSGVPRLRTPDSISTGQEVQRRGEPLPVVD